MKLLLSLIIILLIISCSDSGVGTEETPFEKAKLILLNLTIDFISDDKSDTYFSFITDYQSYYRILIDTTDVDMSVFYRDGSNYPSYLKGTWGIYFTSWRCDIRKNGIITIDNISYYYCDIYSTKKDTLVLKIDAGGKSNNNTRKIRINSTIKDINEFNNHIKTSEEIDADKYILGCISASFDEDWYWFHPDTNQMTLTFDQVGFDDTLMVRVFERSPAPMSLDTTKIYEYTVKKDDVPSNFELKDLKTESIVPDMKYVYYLHITEKHKRIGTEPYRFILMDTTN